MWKWQPLLNAAHTNKLLQNQSHLCCINRVVDDIHPWEHSARPDESFKWSGMVPEPRHSVHTMPALALSPAIWLFQSALTRLVQCQERGMGEREKRRNSGNLLPLYALQGKLSIKCIFVIHVWTKNGFTWNHAIPWSSFVLELIIRLYIISTQILNNAEVMLE